MAHGCCCCCCLQSVGSVAGAIYGSVSRHPRSLETLPDGEALRNSEEIRAAHRMVVKRYWLTVALLTLFAAIVATLIDPNEPGVSLFVIFFFFPVGQLVASGVTWLCILARPPARKSECLSRLGRITLFSFLGALVGCAGLVITFFTMGR